MVRGSGLIYLATPIWDSMAGRMGAATFMTQDSGDSNPGPVGRHGITVALIGAFSAVLVGMINGRVWPFNGESPAPVQTGAPLSLTPGDGAPVSGPRVQQPAGDALPPAPVQTARRFLDEVDPEFDPQVAVNRKIYVQNLCAQPISVRIVYEKLDKTIDGLGEQYAVEAQKIILPASDDGSPASTFRRHVLVHARSQDETVRWSGKYPLTTEAGVINFRPFRLEVDSDGDYRVKLSCEA
jgi:hypothetical protein